MTSATSSSRQRGTSRRCHGCWGSRARGGEDARNDHGEHRGDLRVRPAPLGGEERDDLLTQRGRATERYTHPVSTMFMMIGAIGSFCTSPRALQTATKTWMAKNTIAQAMLLRCRGMRSLEAAFACLNSRTPSTMLAMAAMHVIMATSMNGSFWWRARPYKKLTRPSSNLCDNKCP